MQENKKERQSLFSWFKRKVNKPSDYAIYLINQINFLIIETEKVKKCQEDLAKRLQVLDAVQGNNYRKLKVDMDKLINKVEKDVKAGNKKVAEKDIKVLKKADKKQDKKLTKLKPKKK
jgi:uncharacterized protein with NRDE domain